jgi:hypothetical protein
MRGRDVGTVVVRVHDVVDVVDVDMDVDGCAGVGIEGPTREMHAVRPQLHRVDPSTRRVVEVHRVTVELCIETRSPVLHHHAHLVIARGNGCVHVEAMVRTEGRERVADVGARE